MITKYVHLETLACNYFRFLVDNESLNSFQTVLQRPRSLIMGTPWNIRGSASQLFYQDKSAPEYEALLTITDLPHPDRAVLSSFINKARDTKEAAQYFLRAISPQEELGGKSKETKHGFLMNWKRLVNKR